MQPDDQAEPDEQGPRPDERAERRAAAGPGAGRDPDHEQHDLDARSTASRTRESRMSGASGSFGVTRYQWPRIIAANTPPVAATQRPRAGASSGDRRRARRRPSASAPKTQRRAAGAPSAPSLDEPGRSRRGRDRDDERRRRRGRRTRASAARRGTSKAGSTRIGESPSAGRQRPSRQPGEDPEADGAGGRERRGSRGSPSVRRRSRTTAANEPKREAGQDGPVDEGEVLGDLGRRARRECSRAASIDIDDKEVPAWRSPATPRSPGTATRASRSRPPGGKTILLDPWFGNPRARDGRRRRPLRPPAGHPRPRRPLRRRASRSPAGCGRSGRASTS